MGKVIVLVSNVLEEVNLVLALEESSSNAVYYGVSPTLEKSISVASGWRRKLKHSPHNKILQKRRGGQITSCMLRLAKGSCRRFQNYSKLYIVHDH